MNHQTTSSSRTTGLVKAALVAALYVVLTVMVAPIAYGALQMRVSEILNYLGLYNRRYIYAVTLGVFIANIFSSAGAVDMVIGTASTFVFLWLGRWAGDKFVALNKGRLKRDPMIYKYVIMLISFVLQMLPIAYMLVYILQFEEAFWVTYLYLALSEAIIMAVGAFIMYPISKRINFYE
ncbi:QueT transporter family protein [Fundicoccus culcitae]|uniref:QueT transporter family protein n=1 Tax=Fundicoccus culcitae TaxID=2969821 RepID=A0ABY5P4M2_9LACT|nr:QueT transporter family protein [Fundicoccus culcitae]UUX33701.1 QueT transporter family protein [Fundicoccus culcitae]